jgi:two-component system, NarL family, response regulator LiaR
MTSPPANPLNPQPEGDLTSDPVALSHLIRIVIVEDDPVMRLGLQHALETQAHLRVVGQAEDGHAGVALCLNLEPDLVLMDIGLPGLDGIKATQRIKQALPTTRVIVLTSHTTEHETVLALAQGADAYCIKGSRVEKLLDAIAVVQAGAIYLDAQVRRVVEQLQAGQGPSAATAKSPSLLSDREREVLKLIVDGRSNPEIAQRLQVSTSTVKAHLRNIMTKLGVDDRVQAAVVALKSGLV